MKRSIIITLALIAAIAAPLCASSGWARGLGVLGLGLGGGEVDYCASSACPTCAWQERFECGATAGDDDSDQDVAWVYSAPGATVNDNYTAAPLNGAESLYLGAGSSNNARRFNSITGTDGDVYVAVKIKPDAWTEANHQVVAFTVGVAAKVEFGIVYASGIITTTNAGVNLVYDSNTEDMPNPTSARYWKFRYNNSSGADDGVFQVWHSDTGASGDWTLRHNVTTHVYTSQITGIKLQSTTNNAYIFDDIRVSSSDINY